MLEMLINPKRAERKPWEMFFIGLLYASLSIGITSFLFKSDLINLQYSGWIMILFSVIFTMPFMYYVIKLEEQKDIEYKGAARLLKEHSKALWALLWLFLGFIIAFSFWYVVIPGSGIYFKPQIETFCWINNPNSFEECVNSYLNSEESVTTGSITSKEKVFSIFINNIYVLILILVFSLILGAGALFILSWNASVIAAAVGIYAKGKLAGIPIGFARYMLIHGWLEIAGYIIAALAGGIIGISVIKHDIKSQRFWSVIQDSLNLIILSVLILLVAALFEVFITPIFF